MFVGEREKTTFAKKISVSPWMVSKYLSGTIPSSEILLRISRITGHSMEWFLTGEDTKEPLADPDLEAARKILTCGDELIVRSFRERLQDYRIALERKMRMDALEREVEDLRRLIETRLPPNPPQQDIERRETLSGYAAKKR